MVPNFLHKRENTTPDLASEVLSCQLLSCYTYHNLNIEWKAEEVSLQKYQGKSTGVLQRCLEVFLCV